jgi:hypothetical protein
MINFLPWQLIHPRLLNLDIIMETWGRFPPTIRASCSWETAILSFTIFSSPNTGLPCLSANLTRF